MHLGAADDDRIAVGGHDVPEDALREVDALDEHIAAVDGADECGQIDAGRVVSVVDAFGGREVVVDAAVERPVFRVAAPEFAVTSRADEVSRARHADVALTVGVDHGAHRHGFDARAAREDHGQIVLDLAAEIDVGTFLDVQADVRAEFDASRMPVALGDDHRAAAAFSHGIDGCLYLLAHKASLPGTHLGDGEPVVGKCGPLELRHVEGCNDGSNGVGHHGRSHFVDGGDMALSENGSPAECGDKQREECAAKMCVMAHGGKYYLRQR